MNEEIFNDISEQYAKYRPGYPNSFYKYLCSTIGINKESIIADIGSGTGILTKSLLQKCLNVYAIEPNNDMRRMAEITLKNEIGFFSINGTAENTTLKDHSIDFVTASQSFHWFDRKSFKHECKRILKPQGKIILIWNSRDESSDLVKSIDFINKKYCPNFSGSSKGMRGAINNNDFDDFFSGKYVSKAFCNNISFSLERFIGLHQSASYHLNTNDCNYINYINDLTNIFDAFSKDGKLVMPNFTRSYVGGV